MKTTVTLTITLRLTNSNRNQNRTHSHDHNHNYSHSHFLSRGAALAPAGKRLLPLRGADLVQEGDVSCSRGEPPFLARLLPPRDEA
eukprot:3966073-Karenia_brevis.AAC.1